MLLSGERVSSVSEERLGLRQPLLRRFDDGEYGMRDRPPWFDLHLESGQLKLVYDEYEMKDHLLGFGPRLPQLLPRHFDDGEYGMKDHLLWFDLHLESGQPSFVYGGYVTMGHLLGFCPRLLHHLD
jgi:hypothetical protein